MKMLNQILSGCNIFMYVNIPELLVAEGADITLLNFKIIFYSSILCQKIDNIIGDNLRKKMPWNASLAHCDFLSFVNKYNFHNILKMMRQIPCGINYRDADGKTLLHHICQVKNIPNFHDRIDIAEILLKKGANVFIKDNKGMMPEDYIYSEGLFDDNTPDFQIVDAKNNKEKSRKTFAKNYQIESLFYFLKDVAYADQAQLANCLILLIPREILFLILQYIPLDGSKLGEQQKLINSFRGIESSVATLFRQRKTCQFAIIPQPIQQPIKEFEVATKQKDDRRLPSLQR